METDALFIYGTLRPQTGHPMARRLAGESAFIGPGTIAARLYRLGYFPGAVPSVAPGDIVHGDVVRLLRPGSSLAWLDDYEGCGNRHPEPQAYRRVIVPVRLRSGDRLDAWAYVSISRPPCQTHPGRPFPAELTPASDCGVCPRNARALDVMQRSQLNLSVGFGGGFISAAL